LRGGILPVKLILRLMEESVLPYLYRRSAIEKEACFLFKRQHFGRATAPAK
jgi:hypothetical protein